MTAQEIRRSFLTFFEDRDHRIVPSSPLVPHDDPTLLFTNAGMNQFKDTFLGRERRDYSRAATAQKCMRVSGKHNDLENVGPSLRHHTFFEMLGNFSFGDYFKKEAIEYAWELLTRVWKLPEERLFATVFSGEAGIPRDEDALGFWRRFVPAGRIAELGLADNFWSMGETGPCGRCSEVHYFRGDRHPRDGTPCLGLSCECDSYVEIWNNVFMEFDRQPDGTLAPLPAPSIDTGMGLERIVAVLQGTASNYSTDLFRPLIAEIAALTGESYGPFASEGHAGASDVSFRVIADHARAMTFLIADGVTPSNEWRGYVLRKIMRRAMRHGRLLGLTEPFLSRLVPVIVREMADAYPELGRNQETVVRTILAEEKRFDAVLAQGLPRLETEVATAAAANVRLSGDTVFRLYDTYGLPIDFIEDVAGQQGVHLDRDGFEREMAKQRTRARAQSAFDQRRGDPFVARSDETRRTLEIAGDRFEGYGSTRLTGLRVLAVFDEARGQGDELVRDGKGYVLLDRTPFYLDAGGQVSDVGRLYSEAGGVEAVVDDVVRAAPGWPRGHHVLVRTGALKAGDLLTGEVDRDTRDATRRNHTATHLLHAALREILGTHVKQAGSLVAPDRLRFDFVHFAPVSVDEIAAIERLVNEQIYRNMPVTTEIKATEEAIAAGAMALFGEKYGDRVRVVSIPGFSVELCGGTHVGATGDIGPFAIVAESSIAAGVRRMEAITGAAAVARFQADRRTLQSVTQALGVPAEQVVPTIERLQAEARALARQVSQLKMKAAMGSGSGKGPADDALDVGGVKVVARRVDGLDKTGLRGLADSLKERLGSSVVVLAAASDGKVAIVVSVSPDLTNRVNAGQIVRQIAPLVGGGGGGRADFAEAGGKDASRVDDLLTESRRLLQSLLEP